MLPKFFFENYFQGEQQNYIFVSMPFDNSFDDRFKIIEYVGKELCGFDDVVRTKEKEWSGGEITDKIFNGVAHSKMLLFDLSDDLKYSGEINPNVIYELGIALTFRDTKNILLIRKNNPEKPIEKLPFDIKGLNINEYENGLGVKWLQDRISNCKEGIVYYKELILASVFHSLDEIGIFILDRFARMGKNGNFNIQQIYSEISKNQHLQISIVEVRNSVLRMLELGIIKIERAPKDGGFEFSYHQTFFGEQITEYIKSRDKNYYS